MQQRTQARALDVRPGFTIYATLNKNNKTSKVGVKNKRLTAGWNEDDLAEALFGK
jgi:hypothetical protein